MCHGATYRSHTDREQVVRRPRRGWQVSDRVPHGSKNDTSFGRRELSGISEATLDFRRAAWAGHVASGSHQPSVSVTPGAGRCEGHRHDPHAGARTDGEGASRARIRASARPLQRWRHATRRQARAGGPALRGRVIALSRCGHPHSIAPGRAQNYCESMASTARGKGAGMRPRGSLPCATG